jgi:hypothetical protein
MIVPSLTSTSSRWHRGIRGVARSGARDEDPLLQRASTPEAKTCTNTCSCIARIVSKQQDCSNGTATATASRHGADP